MLLYTAVLVVFIEEKVFAVGNSLRITDYSYALPVKLEIKVLMKWKKQQKF